MPSPILDLVSCRENNWIWLISKLYLEVKSKLIISHYSSKTVCATMVYDRSMTVSCKRANATAGCSSCYHTCMVMLSHKSEWLWVCLCCLSSFVFFKMLQWKHFSRLWWLMVKITLAVFFTTIAMSCALFTIRYFLNLLLGDLMHQQNCITKNKKLYLHEYSWRG